MGLLCVKKQKNLLKLRAKKSSLQLMGGLTGGKSDGILCTSVCMVQKKVLIFLAADEWIKREWPKIIAEYPPEDSYKADETGLYFSAMPEHTYLFKNESPKGFISSKERVTVFCCANMKGEKRDLVIGKSKNPRCFNGVRSLLVYYYSNENAWMTSVIFNDWLVKWDLELKRKIVLLVDACTAHTNHS
jgi:hypothetical protein